MVSELMSFSMCKSSTNKVLMMLRIVNRDLYRVYISPPISLLNFRVRASSRSQSFIFSQKLLFSMHSKTNNNAQRRKEELLDCKTSENKTSLINANTY